MTCEAAASCRCHGACCVSFLQVGSIMFHPSLRNRTPGTRVYSAPDTGHSRYGTWSIKSTWFQIRDTMFLLATFQPVRLFQILDFLSIDQLFERIPNKGLTVTVRFRGSMAPAMPGVFHMAVQINHPPWGNLHHLLSTHYKATLVPGVSKCLKVLNIGTVFCFQGLPVASRFHWNQACRWVQDSGPN